MDLWWWTAEDAAVKTGVVWEEDHALRQRNCHPAAPKVLFHSSESRFDKNWILFLNQLNIIDLS